MFPDEIINITEHRQKQFLDKLGLYINDKNRVIPTNSMSLVAITLEGVNENNKCEAITLDLSEENFKKLYQRGKDLWNNGYISKYIICFMEKDKCFRYVRPDKDNFEKYYRLDNYMQNDDALQIYNTDNKYFLIGDSLKDIYKFYHVEEILNHIPTVEKENGLEIA